MADTKDITRYISSGAWALVSWVNAAESSRQVEPLFFKEGKTTLAKLIDFMEVGRFLAPALSHATHHRVTFFRMKPCTTRRYHPTRPNAGSQARP